MGDCEGTTMPPSSKDAAKRRVSFGPEKVRESSKDISETIFYYDLTSPPNELGGAVVQLPQTNAADKAPSAPASYASSIEM